MTYLFKDSSSEAALINQTALSLLVETRKLKPNDLKLDKLSNKKIDTLALARIYLPQMYNYKLETLKKYFNVKQISHRAVGDCHTTNYVYQECKKRTKAYSFQ